MIQNEKQYKITKKRIIETEDAILKVHSSGKRDLKRQAYLNGLVHLQNQMKAEIRDFEKLQKSGISLKRKTTSMPLLAYPLMSSMAPAYPPALWW